jgi:CHAT domain-containing protein
VLAGRDATVAAVLEAMGRSTLVHVAAHGTFRMDNPMFSTLHLHDGPLHVHELEELEAVPATVVLTACSAGRSGVLPGDELLGTSAVLMALGVRTLVAPLMPVADAAAADVAVAIHSAMRRGQAPDVALGSCVRQAIAEERVDLVAAAASFTCVAAREN